MAQSAHASILPEQAERLPQPEENKPKVILDERGLMDIPFLVLTVLLVMIGVVMMFSASYARAYELKGNSTYYFARQAIFAVTAWCWQKTALALLPATLAGALAGFLVYNFHPAKVFMGDTGSLFLGGAVCGLAFALDMPLVLILVGFVYIVETLSDILQVTYFKLSHGKRIFKMAPIHHHFEMSGWSEVKIFTVFVSVTVAMCLIAWLGVMHRF